jgi:hypothetical protein
MDDPMRTISKKPPALRWITKELRSLHEAYAHPIAGGGCVCLAFTKSPWVRQGGESWSIEPTDERSPITDARHGCEYIPGDGKPFDAVAAARRLQAAWRDGTTGQERQ